MCLGIIISILYVLNSKYINHLNDILPFQQMFWTKVKMLIENNDHGTIFN